MTAARERFDLVEEPRDALPHPAALRDWLSKADAAIVTLGDRIDADTIAAAPRLKILANYAVGYNNIDLDAARRRDLVVTNTPDVLTDATADLTWALLLATARRVVEGDRLVRSGQWAGWAPTQFLSHDVSGKTLGIVGMGRIGRAVAQRALGFQMKVLYHAHKPIAVPSPAHRWEFHPLPTLLREADFITLHVPLTPDTRHLLGAREFAMMRSTAMVINTARGPIIDEAALVAALQTGTIAGAGLDVYEEEPALHPGLASLQQVVLLPHLGSATWHTRVQMGMICLKNIDAVLGGQRAPNEVGST
jgi:glyoxylate reductase